MPNLSKKTALSEREIEFLDRLNAAANLLAMPGVNTAEAVRMLQDTYADMDELTARKWLFKAKEYIATGAPVDAEALRNRYAAKLRALIDKTSRFLVIDEIEITTNEKGEAPAADDKEDKEKDGPAAGRSTKTKRKPNVFQPQVGQLLFKMLREEAIVTGARPKDGSAPKPVAVTNVQNNFFSGASKTTELSNEQLLARTGLTSDVKVLPPARGNGEGAEARQRDDESVSGAEAEPSEGADRAE